MTIKDLFTNDILTMICGMLIALSVLLILREQISQYKRPNLTLGVVYIMLAFSVAIPILRFFQII